MVIKHNSIKSHVFFISTPFENKNNLIFNNLDVCVCLFVCCCYCLAFEMKSALLKYEDHLNATFQRSWLFHCAISAGNVNVPFHLNPVISFPASVVMGRQFIHIVFKQ